MTSIARRRAVFVAALVAIMPLSGWEVTYDAWRAVLGDDVGTSMAVFWDLQVETWWNALLVVLALDLVYGMHRDGGRWAFAYRGRARHVAAYVGLAVLMLICAAEGPWRDVLQLVLPDDIGASVAHYFRRGLEGVMASIGVMVFLDVVRPGGLRHSREPSGASAPGPRSRSRATVG